MAVVAVKERERNRNGTRKGETEKNGGKKNKIVWVN